MNQAKNSHILKVFSGPHVGAEMLLAEGEYVIGSGEDCDVVLDDQLIAERHAKVAIRPKDIQCVALDGSVVVDGEDVSSAPLKDFQFFTLGNTHLAVGPADATWPKLTFPEFRLDKAAEKKEEASEEQTDEDDQDDGEEDAAAEKAQSASEVAAEENSRTAGAGGRAVTSAVLIAMLLIGGLFIWMSNIFSSEPPAPAPEITLDDVNKVVSEHVADATLVVVEETDDGISVSGCVSTLEETKELTNALDELQPPPFHRIWDTESLSISAQKSLGPEFPFQARPGKPGQVILEGSSQDKELYSKWPAAKQRIRKDIKRIQDLQDDVKFTMAAAKPRVIRPSETPGTTQEADQTAGDSTAATKPSGKGGKATSGEVSKIEGAVSSAIMSELPDDLPKLRIRSVSIGRLRVVTLIGGERIFENGVLPGGYVVKSIEADKLVLTRGGYQIEMHLQP